MQSIKIFKKPNSWNVLYTTPRSEIKVADRLSKMGFNVYCPTRVEIRQWSDRKKKLKVPLLPSMVLINIDEQLRSKVFDIPGTVRYMFWLGRIAKVSEEEVDVLKKGLKENAVIDHKISKLSLGSEIEIPNCGGKKGIIQKKSQKKIWVELKELNFVIALNVA